MRKPIHQMVFEASASRIWNNIKIGKQKEKNTKRKEKPKKINVLDEKNRKRREGFFPHGRMWGPPWQLSVGDFLLCNRLSRN